MFLTLAYFAGFALTHQIMVLRQLLLGTPGARDVIRYFSLVMLMVRNSVILGTVLPWVFVGKI